MIERKKLSSVLLVDDNVAINLIHQKLIKRQDLAEHVYTCTSARQALNFIKANHGTDDQEKHIKPELLFLDINMPGMDGWDFLIELRKINDDVKEGMIIYMLTTSINPEDRQKAVEENIVSGFINKPLSSQALNDVFERHFASKRNA